ncbi:hypothetical protein NKH56_33500 [Mesorhizobium sp. M1076]|uniref:hypothetical protein n=1 Tax=Mesorhizobium sp. M1076 TaxID=2957054 RepID=UPI00333B1748
MPASTGTHPYYNLSTIATSATYVDAALADGQLLYYHLARGEAQRRSCTADSAPRLIFRIRVVGGHAGALD